MLITTFWLGPGGAHLSGRVVELYDRNTVPPTLLDSQSLAGTDELVDLDLPDNRLLEIVLTDTAASGVELLPARLLMQTSEPAFTQRLISGGGHLAPVGYDEESSSSSQSSSSSSTSSLSSQSSSSSSSSLSSSTSSSSQSVSTSSSSQTLSESSLSSLSTSSLSTTSTSSVSSSSLSSSSSSGP